MPVGTILLQKENSIYSLFSYDIEKYYMYFSMFILFLNKILLFIDY